MNYLHILNLEALAAFKFSYFVGTFVHIADTRGVGKRKLLESNMVVFAKDIRVRVNQDL